MSGGAVLLAAGFSRRFGSDKRSHVLADGTPLLFASLARYLAVFADLIVVLRPEDLALADGVRQRAPSARVVRCPDAHLGMGHSLACGIRAAAGWDYAFVALADMAWVGEATLGRLRTAMESTTDGIVRPVHGHTPGHPVGFAAEFFPALAALTGDSGARDVLAAHGDRVRCLPVNDPGILQDLDVAPRPDDS